METQETPRLKQAEVAELIKKVRMDPRASNKPVLGVNTIALQVAKNGGFPKHMYHDYLDPIVVLGPEEELEVAKIGYSAHYIKREYPGKWLYRRNMAEKFAGDYQINDKGVKVFTPNPFGAYVEGVQVASAEAEKALREKKTPHGCGPWVAKISDIEELPEAPLESPDVTQARLEGELAALRAQLAAFAEGKQAKPARV